MLKAENASLCLWAVQWYKTSHAWNVMQDFSLQTQAIAYYYLLIVQLLTMREIAPNANRTFIWTIWEIAIYWVQTAQKLILRELA